MTLADYTSPKSTSHTHSASYTKPPYSHITRTPRPRRRKKIPTGALVAIIIVAVGTVLITSNKDVAGFFSYLLHGNSEPSTTMAPPVADVDLEPIEETPATETTPEGFYVFQDIQPPYAKTADTYGARINIINNPEASNPPSQQLLSFLNSDPTDKDTYDVFLHPCGAFAEEVHNNAESRGIRAGWVAVDFCDGTGNHACNAFQTTDYDLVFVDCTGEDRLSKEKATITPLLKGITWGEINNWDKIAYIEIGKIYGVIEASHAVNYGFDYSDYQQWQRDVSTFDAQHESYERQLGGRTYVSESEYYELNRQLSRLDSLANKIGGFYEPLGIVGVVKIYW